MLSTTRKTLVAGAIAFALGALSPAALAAGMAAAPAVGNLGPVVVDPYGNAPLTALINLNSHDLSEVTVTVKGKGKNGVTISYPVGRQSLLTYDGIPIFGLYQKYDNHVTIEYTEKGKRNKDSYVIRTSSIVNKYMDNRSISDLQQIKRVKVDKGFEDRLYLINTHTLTAQGSEFHWSGDKTKDSGLLEARPAIGS